MSRSRLELARSATRPRSFPGGDSSQAVSGLRGHLFDAMTAGSHMVVPLIEYIRVNISTSCFFKRSLPSTSAYGLSLASGSLMLTYSLNTPHRKPNRGFRLKESFFVLS